MFAGLVKGLKAHYIQFKNVISRFLTVNSKTQHQEQDKITNDALYVNKKVVGRIMDLSSVFMGCIIRIQSTMTLISENGKTEQSK